MRRLCYTSCNLDCVLLILEDGPVDLWVHLLVFLLLNYLSLHILTALPPNFLKLIMILILSGISLIPLELIEKL